MIDNSFDYIAQELLKQKRVMDALQAENRDLRRQLGELRTGRGIFIEIAGQRFPLIEEAIASHPIAVSTPTAQLEPSAPSIVATPPIPTAPLVVQGEAMPHPQAEQVTRELVLEAPAEKAAPIQQKQEELTFLEEIMLDEFATASTNHLATWPEPAKKQEPEVIDEDKKAALRRELMGSFLLE